MVFKVIRAVTDLRGLARDRPADSYEKCRDRVQQEMSRASAPSRAEPHASFKVSHRRSYQCHPSGCPLHAANSQDQVAATYDKRGRDRR
jgi:hypothetical protein